VSTGDHLAIGRSKATSRSQKGGDARKRRENGGRRRRRGTCTCGVGDEGGGRWGMGVL